MSLRAQMTHRVLVERDGNAGQTDAYNNPQAPSWATHIAAQPCYYYEPAAQRGEQQGERNVNLYTHQVLMPLGVDITEADRINGVVDRRGTVITDKLLNVVAVVRRRDHLLVTLAVAT